MPLRSPRGRSYRDVILADHPIGYWRLGLLGGFDESGRGNHAVIKGSAKAGRRGALPNDPDPGIKTSATGTSFAQVTVASPATVTAPFTVEAWYFMQVGGGTSAEIYDSRGPTDWGFNMKQSTAAIGDGGAWLTTTANYSGGSTLWTWYHLAYVVTAANWTAYLNGIKVAGPTTITGTALLWDANHIPCIGRAGSTQGSYMEGCIDEVACYDYALSAEQIKQHFMAQSAPGFMIPVFRPLVVLPNVVESSGPASDSVARAATFARSISESTSASDTATRLTAEARSVAESVTAASENVSRAQVFARSISESVAVSDSVSRATNFSRSVSESISASDTPTRQISLARSAAEVIRGVVGNYRALVLADGASAYWRLDEASGTSAADSTGNGNTGTLHGGVTLGAAGVVADDSDAAMSLDGTGWISFTGPNWGAGAPFSIECWIKPSDPSTGQWPLDGDQGAGDLNFQLVNGTTATCQVRVQIVGASSSQNITDPGTIAAGSWAHLVMTYDGTNLRLYVNSALKATGATFTTAATLVDTWTWGERNNGQFKFKGVLDECALYPLALTSGQVANHYAAAGLAETVSRTYAATRSPSESVGAASDTVGRGAPATRALSEIVGPAADSVARPANFPRSITESVRPATDAVARGFSYGRNISETNAVPYLWGSVTWGSFTWGGSYPPTPVTDTVTRAFTAARTIAESVSATDTPTRPAGVNRSLTESSAAPTDAVARAVTFPRAISESRYGSTALGDSPLAFWRFQETAGTAAADSSGLGHPGTVIGGVTLGAAGGLTEDGKSFAFNGTTGRVTTTLSGWTNSDFTVEFWAAASAAASTPVQVAAGIPASFPSNLLLVYHADSSQNRGLRVWWAGTSILSYGAAAQFADGTWRHIALTRSGTTFRLYVNGAEVANATNASSFTNTYTWIGAASQSGSPTQFANGSIDEVAVYGSALSPSALLAHYTAGAITDSVSRTATWGRVVTESSLTTDTVSRVLVAARGLAESAGTSADTVTQIAAHARTSAEVVGPALDSITRAVTSVSPGRAVAEAVGPASDAVSTGRTTPRSIAESVGPAVDALARTPAVLARIVAETVTATDVAGRNTTNPRPLSEAAVAAVDAVARLFGAVAAISESTTTSDAAMRQFAPMRSPSESVGPAFDVAVFAGSGVRVLSEIVGPAVDAVSHALGINRTIAESAGTAADAVSRPLALIRALTEAVGATVDAVSQPATLLGRVIAEVLSPPTDTVTASRTVARIIAEAVAATDAVSRFFGAPRSVSESVGAASDAVAASRAEGRNVSESVLSLDAILRQTVVLRGLPEGFPSSDTTTRGVMSLRSLPETTGPTTEQPSQVVGFPRGISEVVFATESPVRAWIGARAPAETVGPAGDSPSPVATLPRTNITSIRFVFRDGRMTFVFRV